MDLTRFIILIFPPANNTLTGSIPKELLDIKGSVNVFGNQLSGLIPVEGDAICSAEGGEHYCNCNTDCTFNPNFCGCKEAESCCTSFVEQFTECNFCENSGLQNPDFLVLQFIALCSDISNYVKADLIKFGTDKQCKGANQIFTQVGCVCSEEDPNANTPDTPSTNDIPVIGV